MLAVEIPADQCGNIDQGKICNKPKREQEGRGLGGWREGPATDWPRPVEITVLL